LTATKKEGKFNGFSLVFSVVHVSFTLQLWYFMQNDNLNKEYKYVNEYQEFEILE
jgi:hypothetical protein